MSDTEALVEVGHPNKPASLTDLTRAYRVARSAIVPGAADEVICAPSATVLRRHEAARLALVEAAGPASDIEAVDVLRLAEDLLTELPCTPSDDAAVIKFAITRVAAYLGDDDHPADAFQAAVQERRENVAACTVRQLAAIYDAAERAEDQIGSALDGLTAKSVTCEIVDDLTLGLRQWRAAAAAELRERFAAGAIGGNRGDMWATGSVLARWAAEEVDTVASESADALGAKLAAFASKTLAAAE